MLLCGLHGLAGHGLRLLVGRRFRLLLGLGQRLFIRLHHGGVELFAGFLGAGKADVLVVVSDLNGLPRN